ncbi:MAG: GntR family transcriptional regulator [Thermomicrobiales bacterium]
MVVTTADSPATLDPIADQIFHFLWGEERDPLPTAGDHAYKQIWRQLITGARKPGERLSDVELSAQLGVSRTPVRQALQRLVQDELVRSDPRRGFWVREFTATDVHEMYDVRAALEALAVRQGAANLRPADLRDQLDRITALRDQMAEQPVVPFLQHDFQFHNLLIYASRNGRLIRILAALRSQVSFFQIRDTGYPRRMDAALDGHERILRALLAGRVDEAADLMMNHIAASKAGVLGDMFASTDGAEGKEMTSVTRR